MRRLAQIQVYVGNWTRPLGPLAAWRSTMRDSYEEAVSADKVEEWRLIHQRILDDGRYISAMLADLALLEWPVKRWQVRDLWVRAFSLSATVHEGIACLETWIMALSGR